MPQVSARSLLQTCTGMVGPLDTCYDSECSEKGESCTPSCCPAGYTCQYRDSNINWCYPINPPAEPPASNPAGQFLTDDCTLEEPASSYPNGLTCSGTTPSPACCGGELCYVFREWVTKPNPDFVTDQPSAGLGSCQTRFVPACCPALTQG